MYILKNWSIKQGKLRGYIYNHPDYPEHHPIQTSPIIDYDVRNRIITTKSAHKYKLENPSKNYKEFVKKNNPGWKHIELLEWSDDK